MTRDDEGRFRLLIEALRPALNEVVIVGGWAHALFRSHHLARAVPYPALRTLDADVALPGKAPTLADLRQRLLDRGFSEELRGEDRPPVAHFHLGTDSAFYAEFLTPLIGSEGKRGRPDVTASIGGVSAQKLRYLEILLIEPWLVPFTIGAEQMVIRIPNAASYIVQKILISDRRTPADRAKDVLYIHDTFELFGAAVSTLKRLWTEKVRPRTPKGTAKRLVAARGQLLGGMNDIIREAAFIAPERGPSPQRILEVCQIGLSRILD